MSDKALALSILEGPDTEGQSVFTFLSDYWFETVGGELKLKFTLSKPFWRLWDGFRRVYADEDEAKARLLVVLLEFTDEWVECGYLGPQTARVWFALVEQRLLHGPNGNAMNDGALSHV